MKHTREGRIFTHEDYPGWSMTESNIVDAIGAVLSGDDPSNPFMRVCMMKNLAKVCDVLLDENERLQRKLDIQTAELCDWRASNPSVRTPAQFEELERENERLKAVVQAARHYVTCRIPEAMQTLEEALAKLEDGIHE